MEEYIMLFWKMENMQPKKLDVSADPEPDNEFLAQVLRFAQIPILLRLKMY